MWHEDLVCCYGICSSIVRCQLFCDVLSVCHPTNNCSLLLFYCGRLVPVWIPLPSPITINMAANPQFGNMHILLVDEYYLRLGSTLCIKSILQKNIIVIYCIISLCKDSLATNVQG